MKNMKWALGFLGLVVLCLLAIVLRKAAANPPKTAQILQNGEVIRDVDLNVDEPYEFTVGSPYGGYNKIRVENGKIAVAEADCPDKICVRQGFISSGTLPIVCLPHKLSVVISDNKSGVDAISGGMAK